MAHTIWVLCGGSSPEHEISIRSAHNVVAGLLDCGFEVSLVYIDRQGSWNYLKDAALWQSFSDFTNVIKVNSKTLLLCPGAEKPCLLADAPHTPVSCDCVFSVVHGTQGEDGQLQGLLNMLKLPYVGSDVLASSVCMAKHLSKALLNEAGIATAAGIVLYRHQPRPEYADLAAQLGATLFIKPSSCGSSLGVVRVENAQQFEEGIEQAFAYDDVLLIETAIEGREIELSVLGNESTVASLPGEIICQQGFYSYQAKYIDAAAARVQTPATLTPEQVAALQQIAVTTYQVLQCSGLARVDCFLTADNRIYVNEVNTLPGFTDISMYPKNWQASGVDNQSLLTRLIDLALQRFEQKQRLSSAVLINNEAVGV